MEQHARGQSWDRTRIVKFFLHLSKGEQCRRFLARIDDPDKNWKSGAANIEEKRFWKHHMHAYENRLGATSTSDSPWHVVLADREKHARLVVSQVALDAFDRLRMHCPKMSAEREWELRSIRKRHAS